MNALERLPEALDALWPLSRAHRADLPRAVRELSFLLTRERESLNRYWSAPRFVSAYLRYFLPWNLVRLAQLLPSLPLDPPQLCPQGTPLVADLGSGPLTLPIALWLARPDWRERPLTLICADTAPRPLELGRRLLELVAEQAGEPLRWRVETWRLPLMHALRKLSRMRGPDDFETEAVQPEGPDKKGAFGQAADSASNPAPGASSGSAHGLASGSAPGAVPGASPSASPDPAPGPALIMAGNVLNEALDRSGEILSERLEELAEALGRALPPEGRALLVEPGGRLGGTLTARLREAGLELGLHPFSPCPHDEPCPLLGRRDRGWCHFSSRALGPDWLLDLSREAGLPKKSLSLAFMLLGTSERQEQEFPASKPPAKFSPQKSSAPEILARILSDPFPVPGMGAARYACAAPGLAILPRAGSLPCGALVPCRQPEKARRDGRSGALELSWEENEPEWRRHAR